jgi:two-component system chemotaxis sensor kinase CheA
LLSLLREGELALSEEITSALLATVDAVREMLGAVEATGGDGDGDYSALIATLNALQRPRAAPAAARPPTPQPAEPAENPRMGELLVERGAATPEQVTLAAHEQELGDPRRIGEILVGQANVHPVDVVEALATQGGPREASVADSSIRVDVGLLDNLMNLVGELVLARNQIVQLTTTNQENEFVGASQRLNLITTELQGGHEDPACSRSATSGASSPASSATSR